jgi:hypothetical protein
MIGATWRSFLGDRANDRFGVGQPDHIVLLQAIEDAPQVSGTVACADDNPGYPILPRIRRANVPFLIYNPCD